MVVMLDALVEETRDHEQTEDAERNVEPKDRGPTRMRDQERTDERSRNGRDAPDAREVALHLGARGTGVDVADHRRRERHHTAGAEPLQSAVDDEHNHVVREAAEDRADQEQRDRDEDQFFAAVNVGEASVYRDRHRLREQINTEDPAEEPQSAEIADDRRDGRRNDRRLNRNHEDRQARRDENHAVAFNAGRRRCMGT